MNLKLWAILHGLEIASQRDYDYVIVESDCLVGLGMIKDNSVGASSSTIARKIKLLASWFRMIDFHYVQRENNLMVDYLARTCGSGEVDLHVILTPSEDVKKLLLDDNNVNNDV